MKIIFVQVLFLFPPFIRKEIVLTKEFLSPIIKPSVGLIIEWINIQHAKEMRLLWQDHVRIMKKKNKN